MLPPSVAVDSSSRASLSSATCSPSPALRCGSGAASCSPALFLEVFSGAGDLTKAMARVKVDCLEPQDYSSGGVDFSNCREVEELWEVWRSRARGGNRLFFHFAPPCNTFSRARDRSVKTRLRSSSRPAGLYPEHPATKLANLVADNTLRSIKFLVEELGAQGTLEQPAGSYLASYFDLVEWLGLETTSTTLHQCWYGRPYKKPTTFWYFGGLHLRTLARKCENMSCGRCFHVELGFGKTSTSPAAAYSPALCAAYAAGLKKHIVDTEVAQDSSRKRLRLTTSGKVRRHVDRGASDPSRREARAAEDAASRAGHHSS